MKMEQLMDQLRSLVPKENFKQQPENAREEILKLEKEYEINTSALLQGVKKESIPEEIIDFWMDRFQTFIDFGGETSNLNHINENYSDNDYISNNNSFLNVMKDYDSNFYDSFFIEEIELIEKIKEESFKDSSYFLLYLLFPSLQRDEIRTLNLYP